MNRDEAVKRAVHYLNEAEDWLRWGNEKEEDPPPTASAGLSMPRIANFPKKYWPGATGNAALATAYLQLAQTLAPGEDADVDVFDEES